ncbi:hypothetical protein DCC39_16935 [Pueribacillus theae]|uniref:DUF3267 domain-containing protein n=1 Tax=Pueribacillus theae TaxID=2171751 RepID=A0A2U1JQE3_9BACI|nr:hypothetical protein [Pueribacillus theae]PWA07048.1 hypothetical protein DCC39_16935 [Pueribacillus theae]
MFTLHDMGTFAWAFFITLPLTIIIHIAGHAFFAFLFGAKPKVEIGSGRKLIKVKHVQIRHLYFINASCKYDSIRNEKRWKHALIYAGGSIFNLSSIFVVNGLIHFGIFQKHLFFYQFVYFSIYFIFFSLLPIQYANNWASDGKAIYEVLRHGKIYNELD